MFNVLFQPAKKPEPANKPKPNSKEKKTTTGENQVQFKNIRLAQSLTTKNKMFAADHNCLLLAKSFLKI